MTILDESFLARLEQAHANDPDATDYADVDPMVARFQQRFPIDRLRELSGLALLNELHGRQSQDSLAYWLEFREKPDFRARLFGSIRGGSALKFGIYQRAEDGEWYEYGGQSGTQRKLSMAEAIAIGERQRDQLLRAREVVARLPEDPAQGRYDTLQGDIETAAPDLASLAFLHKYLCLQFPDRLDDFHSYTHHAHHLLLMGQEPPPRGLYTSAGRMISAWREFSRRRNLPEVVFSHLLNLVNGAPFSWWRIGTSSGDTGESVWPSMRDGGLVSLGWGKLGDLSALIAGRVGSDAKEAIRETLAKHYPEETPQVRGKSTNQIWSFYARIQEGDHVLAADGQTILGIGRIKDPYVHSPGQRFPHTRAVEWLQTEPFRAPDRTGLLTAVFPMDGHWAPLLAAVQRLSSRSSTSTRTEPTADPQPKATLPALDPTTDVIAEELRRKAQVVLYGPPGTGKTWHAARAAGELSARATFGRTWLDLSESEREGLLGRGDPRAQRIWTCTFHPSYGYEEFVEGLRPTAATGQLSFQVQPGLFRRVCAHAAEVERGRGEPRYLIVPPARTPFSTVLAS